MSIRPLIWIGFLIFFNAVYCLTLSNADQTITLDECFRMMHENSSALQSQMKPKCLTNGCVKTAAQIMDYIDENVDPCDNFYRFASGRFIDESSTIETEDDQPRSFYSTVSDVVKNKLGILLSDPLQPNEWKPFRLAKNFYASCVNQEIIVRRGNQELIDMLDVLEGFPAVEGSSWLSSQFDLIRLTRKAKDLGLDTDIIFNVVVEDDLKNTTNRVLYIGSGSYEIDEDDSRKYREQMIEILNIFADKSDEKAKARISKEMEKVYAFEKKLSEISSANSLASANDNDGSEEVDTKTKTSDAADAHPDGQNDDSHSIYTINQLQEMYPYLNWLDYVNALLPDGLIVTEDEPVVNTNARFFERLAGVMNTTSRRTIANYIVWRAVYRAYKVQLFETGKALREKCFDLTSTILSVPVGLLYSNKYLNEKTRQGVTSLVEDVQHTFIDMLADVRWMDEAHRRTAILKAENIIAHVGYPIELYEKDGLSDYYANLEMEPDTFFNNTLRWNLFNSNHQFNSLRQPVNRSGWEALLPQPPTQTNAYYVRRRNAIHIPMAILHELFFSVDRPQYINYASLGNTIGHEITHGFDDIGRTYDPDGNLINWWNSEAEQNFSKEAECFIDQYSHYTDSSTNLTVNGERTLNENIADNGGTRAAYYAYLKWIKRNGDEGLLPGLKYNQKQLFWISYAHVESSVYSQDVLSFIIATDEHTPNEFRANGVVSNLQEFANDFNCLVGIKMNPLKKCRLW